MKRDWSAPNCFNTFENFELFKVDVIGRFKDQRTNKYTCNICPVNPSFHNMPRKYFKCNNTDCDCEVEEPDCVCFKCTAEMKVEICTQKTRMVATGKHLKSCYEATKIGLIYDNPWTPKFKRSSIKSNDNIAGYQILGLQKCKTLCSMKGFPKLTCHQ